MWGFFKTLALLLFLSCVAFADAGLMLGESTGQGMSRWTSAGHSAVYLSRVCPDGPVHLRLCAPGEQGSVISNYISFNEDKPYEWNIVPLSVFLYGVDDAKDRPLYASPELREALQRRFRENYLGEEVCPAGPCSDPKAHWRDVVAANFVRDIYMFEVRTTVQQDEAFIAKFNALPNVDHYNGFTRNCADFARLVINAYFPGAAKPDHINDFWMTSPKAISKSFAHYAVKHPDLHFRVVRFTQIPGSYRRSSDARKGTELVFTSKKWFFPMLLRSNELMMFTASYALIGRFNPERELRRRPTEDIDEDLRAVKAARRADDRDAVIAYTVATRRQRDAIFGTRDQWDNFEQAVAEYREQPLVPETQIRDAKDLATFLDAHGEIFIDDAGAIWVDYSDDSGTHRIGVSATNVNANDSNPDLAYTLLLSRAGAELRAPSKNREMLPEFQADWQLLQAARIRVQQRVLARESDDSPGAGAPPNALGEAQLP
ncbi:MAG TPA: hypothetical protein VGL89_15830 [Candidatus Koribacter sp.]|jgi:hypothetical protein